MAEVYSLSPRLNHEGVIRLAEMLEQGIATNADLGPRWPQIRALGLSLLQLSRELGEETDRLAFELDTTPEVEAFRDSLYQLGETFSQLGLIAGSYPSDM